MASVLNQLDQLQNLTDDVARTISKQEVADAKNATAIKQEEKRLEVRQRLIDGCVFRHTLREVLASFKPALQTKIQEYYMMTIFYLHRQLVRLCGEEMSYYTTKKIDQVIRKDYAALKPTRAILDQMARFEQTILQPHATALKARRPKPKKMLEKIGLLQDLITCYLARYA